MQIQKLKSFDPSLESSIQIPTPPQSDKKPKNKKQKPRLPINYNTLRQKT